METKFAADVSFLSAGRKTSGESSALSSHEAAAAGGESWQEQTESWLSRLKSLLYIFCIYMYM